MLVSDATWKSRCRSALLRPRREISRLSTMPTSPAATLAINSLKPLRPALLLPDLP